MPTLSSRPPIPLAQIDAVLEKQGSDKSRILDATIFLADKSDFAAMNKAWDAWVVAGHAPVRCTVEATLMNPQYKVEIENYRRGVITRPHLQSARQSARRYALRAALPPPGQSPGRCLSLSH